nr:MAG TPA_asm: hypothetical protein [Caudoviricetes sp.]
MPAAPLAFFFSGSGNHPRHALLLNSAREPDPFQTQHPQL